MSEQEEWLPRVPFTTEELQGIVSLVQGHVKYLQSLPLTPKLQKSIDILSSVGTKLARQLVSQEEQVMLPLTGEEVEHLIVAFVIFLGRLPDNIPKSEGRDNATYHVTLWIARLCSSVTEYR
ncbi:MAG: hypothetical protein H0V70_29220 [Ktedonobacteraceae bacterium]|nr:hypothetical protein [Ktedonobacteraceae bacterium]